MRRFVVWIIAAPLVLGIGLSISLLARHAGAGSHNAGANNVDVTHCPATSPYACLVALGRLYDLSAGPLPQVSVPRTFAYLGGELLDDKTEGRPSETLTFRASDERTYEIDLGPLDATHKFPTVDPRPTRTTPSGRDYKENRGSQGIIGISFVDSRFVYVVQRPLLAVLDPSSGTLREAEALVDSIRVAE
jgi:hypothetical protein